MIIVAEKCVPDVLKKYDRKKCRIKTSTTPVITEETETSDRNNSGEALVCCDCASVITFSCEKIKVNDAYNHSFANPHGLFFEISCFKNAPGCTYSNESSTEFTWFIGYSWQIAVCHNCMNHIGWLFSSSKSSFHGLISERLIPARTVEE